MINKNNWIWYVLGIILLIVLIKDCTDKPKEIIRTKTVTEVVYDTIREVKTIKEPYKVYVERTKTIKGKDSLVYREKPSDSTITANKYITSLVSDGAKADLEITFTGKLIDLTGVIKYPKETRTIDKTKIVNASGAFLYLQTNINGFDNIGVGLDYQFKNKILVGAGVNYNSALPDNNINLNVKIGFKL